jgi:hypothetical protein
MTPGEQRGIEALIRRHRWEKAHRLSRGRTDLVDYIERRKSEELEKLRAAWAAQKEHDHAKL